ncbi:hypothetical protein CBL_07437 [Carabus blaptoides fortunei]
MSTEQLQAGIVCLEAHMASGDTSSPGDPPETSCCVENVLPAKYGMQNTSDSACTSCSFLQATHTISHRTNATLLPFLFQSSVSSFANGTERKQVSKNETSKIARNRQESSGFRNSVTTTNTTENSPILITDVPFLPYEGRKESNVPVSNSTRGSRNSVRKKGNSGTKTSGGECGRRVVDREDRMRVCAKVAHAVRKSTRMAAITQKTTRATHHRIFKKSSEAIQQYHQYLHPVTFLLCHPVLVYFYLLAVRRMKQFPADSNPSSEDNSGVTKKIP